MLDLFLCGDIFKLQEEFQDKQNTKNKITTQTTLTLLNKALEHEMFKDLVFEDLF